MICSPTGCVRCVKDEAYQEKMRPLRSMAILHTSAGDITVDLFHAPNTVNNFVTEGEREWVGHDDEPQNPL